LSAEGPDITCEVEGVSTTLSVVDSDYSVGGVYLFTSNATATFDSILVEPIP
jgi:hypothetical protein